MPLENIGRRLTRKYIQNKTPDDYDAENAIELLFLLWIILSILSVYVYYYYKIYTYEEVIQYGYIWASIGIGCLLIIIVPIFSKTNPFYLIWLISKSVLSKLGSKT